MLDLMIGIIFIITILVVLRLIKFMNKEVVDKSKPPLQSIVRIVEVNTKFIESEKKIKHNTWDSIESKSLYDITFEFPNGNRRSIVVPAESNSDWICEGVKGILKLQADTYFISFEKIE